MFSWQSTVGVMMVGVSMLEAFVQSNLTGTFDWDLTEAFYNTFNQGSSEKLYNVELTFASGWHLYMSKLGGQAPELLRAQDSSKYMWANPPS